MIVPKGGRGLKAPYETVIIRVPVPMIKDIENQVEAFRDLVFNGLIDPKRDTLDQYEDMGLSTVSYYQAIKLAKTVLNQKKGARKSVVKLLHLLYSSNVSEEEIENLLY